MRVLCVVQMGGETLVEGKSSRFSAAGRCRTSNSAVTLREAGPDGGGFASHMWPQDPCWGRTSWKHFKGEDAEGSSPALAWQPRGVSL